jgi:ubiquinone/menaquinone biosynthesis C-methylase UbiE
MYDRIAHFYDITHANLSIDIKFVCDLAEKSGGEMLELGCGSGRLLLPLAQAGHVVTGIDNSKMMLARARERIAAESEVVQQRITLIEADMTRFGVENAFTEHSRTACFSLIIIPYNTFLHLNDSQATATLKHIRKHLTKDGSLFIDLINPFAIADTPDTAEFTFEGQFTDPTTGETILQFAANHLDEANQTLHINWAYDVAKSDGTPSQRTIAKSTYHYRFPHQLDLLLQQTGLKLTTIYGDYDRSSFNEESERLLLIAN